MMGHDDEMMKKMLMKKKPMLSIKIGMDDGEEGDPQGMDDMSADDMKKQETSDLAPEVKDKSDLAKEGDTSHMDLKSNALMAYLGQDPTDDGDDNPDMGKDVEDNSPKSFTQSVRMHAMKGLKKAKMKA